MKNTAAYPIERLKKRADFVRLTHKGAYRVKPAFSMQYLPNNAAMVRVGFTASKKLSKRAVDRNRAKRRLRAAADYWLRLHPEVQVPQGLDICFIARPAIFTTPWADLLQDIQKTLRHAGLKWGDKHAHAEL